MPENLIEHFEDTLHRCESEALRDATRQAMEGTKVYREDFRAQQPLMPRYVRPKAAYTVLTGGTIHERFVFAQRYPPQSACFS